MRSPLWPLTRTGWYLTQRSIPVPPTAGVPTPERRYLPGRGETAIVDVGRRDAEPLFLLHGLACTGLLNWYPALPALAERYRVIILDQRWHGAGIRSNTFSLEDCAEDVLALADALDIERFTVAGYSMGGLVGQLLALRSDGRLRGLVLCATTSGFRRSRRHNAVLDAYGSTAAMWQARARLATLRDTPAADLTDHRWLYAQFRSTKPAEIMAAVDVIGRFDSTPWLRGIAVPTSVVVTAKDRAIPAVHQYAVVRAIPAANSFEIDAGHAACVFRPGMFVPALAAACASVHSRSR
ncbi:MAG: alpha/beta fold hydrolase [Haloechinothrix sp.]